MKFNKKIIYILIIIMIFSCKNSKSEFEIPHEKTIVIIEEGNYYKILLDKNTKQEYIFYYEYGHGFAGLVKREK